MLRWLVVLVALTGLTSPAAADIVHMKDGRKIEGKIEHQSASEVHLKTRFGLLKLKRIEIARIEIKDTAEDIYRKRYQKVDRSNPGALFDLAMWCKDQGLKKHYLTLLDEVLTLRPSHHGAHEELGHILYKGRWFSKKKLLEYKKEEEKRNLAKGLVLHDGRWMTKDQKMKALGYEKVGEEWVTRAEADRRRSLIEIEKTFGFPMEITNSEHFSVRSTEGEESNKEILGLCEDAYNHFIELFQPDDVQRRIIDYYPVNIYILDNSQVYDTWIESGYYHRYNPPKDTINRYKAGTNFAYFFPRPVIVVMKGRHLVGGGDRRASLLGFIMHHVGHVLIRRFKRGGSVPGWIETGIAHYFEGRQNGYRTISVCEYEGYEDVTKWVKKFENFKEWFEALAAPDVARTLPTLSTLMDRKIEEMDSREMAKSYSMVSFLLEKHRSAFVAAARRALSKERGKRISMRQAFGDAFDLSLQKIETQWRAWLETRPDLKLQRKM